MMCPNNKHKYIDRKEDKQLVRMFTDSQTRDDCSLGKFPYSKVTTKMRRNPRNITLQIVENIDFSADVVIVGPA